MIYKKKFPQHCTLSSTALSSQTLPLIGFLFDCSAVCIAGKNILVESVTDHGIKNSYYMDDNVKFSCV